MRNIVVSLLVFALLGSSSAVTKDLSANEFNDAALASGAPTKAALFKSQVLLDRMGFSVGTIDGRSGDNFTNALRSFQKKVGIPDSGKLDAGTWTRLVATSSDAVVLDYTITRQDLTGPFLSEIPKDLEKRAELKRLDYRDPQELLAERFHMDEQFLKTLNEGKDFESAGTVILVANVRREKKTVRAHRIEVDKTDGILRIYDKADEIVATYPASVGSEEKPAPSGTLKVTKVAKGPTYTYDPEFKFKGVKATKKVTIAPGPNNPVGSVWIGLSEKSYGIHGTSEPSKVGKVESHGCVRLTNWDALELASMVRPGMEVKFID